MISIGDTLRSERFRRGLTLQQVAADIKINPRMLEDIENDAFHRLPCATLARSFVRQYARAMSVDEQEAIAQVDRRLTEVGLPTLTPVFKDRSSIPILPPLADIRNQLRRESSLAAFVWVALACFACATVYSAWRRSWDPGTVANYAEAHAPAVAEPIAEPLAEPPRPAAPDPPRVEAADQASSSPIHVLFTATEPVWISVKSDGTPVYTGTLQAQQSRQFEGASKMIVTVGNAGGVAITLNGKPVGPIGLAGEVRLLELAPGGVFLNRSAGR